MFSQRQRAAFHKGTSLEGRPLSTKEAETIMKPFLPDTPSANTSSTPSPYPSRSASQHRPQNPPKSSTKRHKQRRTPIRNAFKHWVYVFVYTVIHVFFSIYIRCRKSIRAVRHRFYAIGLYHHRTPELIRSDVKGFTKLPSHLSVIVEMDPEEDKRSAFKRLLQDVGELTSWCACAGIPMLSIYERSGVLKRFIPQTHEAIHMTLSHYFIAENKPRLSIRAPNEPAFSPPPSPSQEYAHIPFQINVLLISEEDGRHTMVDLTRVLATMAQKDKIKPEDITTEVVDAELSEIVMDEPELLIHFGPRVVLDGYPPWQVRLTEIFHIPDYTEGVSYPVFMQALERHASAEKRFGK